MLKKGSKLYSILTGTCPKCHSESMYIEKNAFKMTKIFDMHQKCSYCSTVYKIEPSFFYGAMYVSYGVSIAIGFITFLVTNLFFEMEILGSFISIITTLILLYPIILRISRNIWINFFIHYNKNWKDNIKSS